jgi:hypothetical protein
MELDAFAALSMSGAILVRTDAVLFDVSHE